MRNTSHTPGPWRIHDETVIVSDCVGDNCEGAWIGEVVSGSHKAFPYEIYSTEMLANAKLIIAAPDLLETLDWLAQTVHRAHHEGDFETCEKTTCAGARAAIAKATGGDA